MDFYTTLFWIGFLVLLFIHTRMLLTHVQTASRQHALMALTGVVMMFVGSKIGRAFLGIA